MDKEKNQYETPELVEHENLNKVTKGLRNGSTPQD